MPKPAQYVTNTLTEIDISTVTDWLEVVESMKAMATVFAHVLPDPEIITTVDLKTMPTVTVTKTESASSRHWKPVEVVEVLTRTMTVVETEIYTSTSTSMELIRRTVAEEAVGSCTATIYSAVSTSSPAKTTTSSSKAATTTSKTTSKTTTTSTKESSTTTAKTTTKSTTSSKVLSVAPPAATQSGIVAGCTEWYIAQSGDYCYLVADMYGISVNTFMDWNPAVNPPSCNEMYAGDAYCVGISGSTTTAAVATTKAATTTTTSAVSSATTPTTPYVQYNGNGTVAAGWPSLADWVTFDDM